MSVGGCERACEPALALLSKADAGVGWLREWGVGEGVGYGRDEGGVWAQAWCNVNPITWWLSEAGAAVVCHRAPI